MAHLMKFHLLQWEVVKVKFLMNSNMTLTELNLHLTVSEIQPARTPWVKTIKIQTINRKHLWQKVLYCHEFIIINNFPLDDYGMRATKTDTRVIRK